MANISLTLYTNGFFGSVLKSPTQMGSLSMNNSFTNISCLGTFKKHATNTNGIQGLTPAELGNFFVFMEYLHVYSSRVVYFPLKSL